MEKLYLNIIIKFVIMDISVNIYFASLSENSVLFVCSHERLRLADLVKRKTSSRLASPRISI